MDEREMLRVFATCNNNSLRIGAPKSAVNHPHACASGGRDAGRNFTTQANVTTQGGKEDQARVAHLLCEKIRFQTPRTIARAIKKQDTTSRRFQRAGALLSAARRPHEVALQGSQVAVNAVDDQAVLIALDDGVEEGKGVGGGAG